MLTALHRPRDRDHRLHGRQAVINARARLCDTIEDRGRKGLDLQFVGKSVLAQDPVELPIASRKALHVARLVIPGEMNTSRHTPVFTLNLKTPLKVAADRDLEVEMPERAVREIGSDEPAIRPEAAPSNRA